MRSGQSYQEIRSWDPRAVDTLEDMYEQADMSDRLARLQAESGGG